MLTPAIGEDYLSQTLPSAFLQGRRSEEYAFQIVLEPRGPLRERPNLPGDLTLRRSYADLVKIERSGPEPEFQVIDVKAAQRATPFHKAQVAFYSLLLQSALADLRAPGTLSRTGQIWCLPPGSKGEDGRVKAEEFRLEPYLRLVADFFGNEIPAIARSVVSPTWDETFFHIYFKCGNANTLRHCRQAIREELAPANRDVLAVAGGPHEAKPALTGLGIHRGQAGRGPRAARLQRSNWALRRRAEVLEAPAQSLISGEGRRITRVASYLMPPRVDMGLYLVVDVDPVENNLVALGLLRDDGRDPRFHIAVLESGAPEQEREALCAVMSSLIGALADVDAHNRAHENAPEAQIHAHIYLYEPTEGRSLQEAVARHLEDPRVRHGLLNLVRLFPPEDLVPEPEFRGIHHLPATSLRSVVEQLLALPVTVSYDLRQVTSALADTDLGLRRYAQEPVPTAVLVTPLHRRLPWPATGALPRRQWSPTSRRGWRQSAIWPIGSWHAMPRPPRRPTTAPFCA